jgi:hypothetical protein
MSATEPQTLAQLPFKLLEETIRQLRSTRNDIIRPRTGISGSSSVSL